MFCRTGGVGAMRGERERAGDLAASPLREDLDPSGEGGGLQGKREQRGSGMALRNDRRFEECDRERARTLTVWEAHRGRASVAQSCRERGWREKRRARESEAGVIMRMGTET